MRFRNIFIVICLLATQLTFAQSPEQFKYQAAARNSTGQVINNDTVGLRISLRTTSASGNIQYQETHTAMTNNYGVFSLNIGTGSATIGTFSNIDWGTSAYFMQVELDIAGGSNYTDMGTTQLLSVPYALYAKNVENSIWNPGSTYTHPDTLKVMIGNTYPPSHLLQISPSSNQSSLNYTNNALRLTGINSWGHGARLNFGDANYVYIEEDRDDDMTILADRVRMRTDSLKIGWHSGSAVDGARLTFPESFQAHTNSGNTPLYKGYGLQNTGLFTTYGPNGSINTELSALGANVNHGFMGVNDTSGIGQAGMYVDASGDGIIFGDQKNFRIPHPTKEGKEIWYGSLEGPELAAYIRGTADLVNGEVFVSFPEHYELVANPSTMTVVLTPLSANSKGLAVIEKVANGFRIKELSGGTGTYQVDWEVKCVRKGKEGYRPVRDANEVMSLSSFPEEETPILKPKKDKKPEER